MSSETNEFTDFFNLLDSYEDPDLFHYSPPIRSHTLHSPQRNDDATLKNIPLVFNPMYQVYRDEQAIDSTTSMTIIPKEHEKNQRSDSSEQEKSCTTKKRKRTEKTKKIKKKPKRRSYACVECAKSKVKCVFDKGETTCRRCKRLQLKCIIPSREKKNLNACRYCRLLKMPCNKYTCAFSKNKVSEKTKKT